MKRVSFEVAKAIKEAGYPQNSQVMYKENGALTTSFIRYSNTCAAPTYIDVWLWLWREKKIWIQVRHMGNGNWFRCYVTEQDFSDPEEAIIATIEHLVEHNLI